jgi:LytS/YehU family sensor histidine kinase
LGDLLRLSLENENMPEVSLRQELEFLQKYLEIEKTRFHDRLTVDFQIAPETLDARVPSMMLQPLLENAIRHGIAARPGAGRIEVAAERFDGMLEIRVFDDGAGLEEADDATRREGIGLSNTRARLRQLYGERQKLVLENAPAGGFEVLLQIPYRPLIDELK